MKFFTTINFIKLIYYLKITKKQFQKELIIMKKVKIKKKIFENF